MTNAEKITLTIVAGLAVIGGIVAYKKGKIPGLTPQAAARDVNTAAANASNTAGTAPNKQTSFIGDRFTKPVNTVAGEVISVVDTFNKARSAVDAARLAASRPSSVGTRGIGK